MVHAVVTKSGFLPGVLRQMGVLKIDKDIQRKSMRIRSYVAVIVIRGRNIKKSIKNSKRRPKSVIRRKYCKCMNEPRRRSYSFCTGDEKELSEEVSA